MKDGGDRTMSANLSHTGVIATSVRELVSDMNYQEFSDSMRVQHRHALRVEVWRRDPSEKQRTERSRRRA
jgi:hypothetical protein